MVTTQILTIERDLLTQVLRDTKDEAEFSRWFNDDNLVISIAKNEEGKWQATIFYTPQEEGGC